MNRILKEDSEIIISNSRKIVDVRNRIIHGYDSVSDDVIWGIVIRHLPILQKEVEKNARRIVNNANMNIKKPQQNLILLWFF